MGYVSTLDELRAQREKRAKKIPLVIDLPISIDEMPIAMEFTVSCEIREGDLFVEILTVDGERGEFDFLQLWTALAYAQLRVEQEMEK